MPRLNNNGVITEFETEIAFRDHIESISPTPNLSYFVDAFKREFIGKNVVIDLYKLMEDITPALTDAQIQDLLIRVIHVQLCLGDGMILLARKVCNGIATGGQLTQARKNAILQRIDDAILLLNGS